MRAAGTSIVTEADYVPRHRRADPVTDENAAAPRAQGQDRSSWQGIGPWAGVTFGFAKATEALSFADPTFGPNWENLHKERRLRGAYHFFHPTLSASDQAAFFVDHVRSHGLNRGDMLAGDIELTLDSSGQFRMSPHASQRSVYFSADPGGAVVFRSDAPAQYQLSAVSGAELGEVAYEFMMRVHELCPHCPAVVYTNLSVGGQLGKCTRFPLWIAYPGAQAPASVHPWGSWDFWQYAFGGGFDDCDRDVFGGSSEALVKWIDRHSGSEPAPAVRPPLSDEEDSGMPSGVMGSEVGRPEPHSWPEGTVEKIVLTSDWKRVQGGSPVVEVRAQSLTDGFGDAVRLEIPEHGTIVHPLPDHAGANGVSLTRGDTGKAQVSWHTV
jgi:GH25 family lysozyme M1 (1,4-beta-N-acetylmuramidase)